MWKFAASRAASVHDLPRCPRAAYLRSPKQCSCLPGVSSKDTFERGGGEAAASATFPAQSAVPCVAGGLEACGEPLEPRTTQPPGSGRNHAFDIAPPQIRPDSNVVDRDLPRTGDRPLNREKNHTPFRGFPRQVPTKKPPRDAPQGQRASNRPFWANPKGAGESRSPGDSPEVPGAFPKAARGLPRAAVGTRSFVSRPAPPGGDATRSGASEGPSSPGSDGKLSARWARVPPLQVERRSTPPAGCMEVDDDNPPDPACARLRPCPGSLLRGAARPGPAAGTEFSYQGGLRDGGLPANGQYDLRFRLYDAAVRGRPGGAHAVRRTTSWPSPIRWRSRWISGRSSRGSVANWNSRFVTTAAWVAGT